MTPPNPINCTVLGDAGVGKTTLLLCFSTNTFSSGYVPTCVKDLVAKVDVNNQALEVSLYDTPGAQYDTVRSVLRPGKFNRHLIGSPHPDPDIVLVCYSVTSPDSLNSVRDKWVVELKRGFAGIPWLLVGTKIDARDNQTKVLTQEDGISAANNLGAAGYVECSSLTQVGVKSLLREATTVALRGREQQKKRSCPTQ